MLQAAGGKPSTLNYIVNPRAPGSHVSSGGKILVRGHSNTF